MSTCWQILEIEPTTDLDVIKEARRALIKTWHPDRVADEQQKLDHTARCAAINAAFDEASGFAKAWTPPRVTATPRDPEERKRRPRSGGPITDAVTRAGYIIVLSFTFLVFSVINRRVGRFAAFVIPFAVCLFITGFLNSLLLKYALLRLAALKDSKVAAWIVLSVVNIFVLALGLSQFGGQAFGTFGGAAFDAAVGLVIPAYVSTRSV